VTQAADLRPASDGFRGGLAGIVTVAASKGGVGKTTLASELAFLLGAVLIDLDWDRGGVSRAWGYRHEARKTAPLLDALESGRTPRPLHARFRADLVPSHPDFANNQPAADDLATELERWAREWDRPVIADTHPGGVPSTYGAVAAARVVLVPAPLFTKELDALEGTVEELRDYPLLIIPNMVPRIPPAREIERLEKIAQAADVPVGPAVSDYGWLKRRQRRMAVTAGEPVPARAQGFVDELRQVADVVRSYVTAG
jgi:chromosome partitioning protein